MKNLLLIAFIAITLSISCTKEDTTQSSRFELSTLDSLTHDHATELLRLNILAEYGGVFKQMELYHAEVFDVGMPCDSSFTIELAEENLPNYSFKIPLEINTDCTKAWMVYNDRFYRGYQKEGTHTAESESFAIEALLSDNQTIVGNFDDDVYTYGQLGSRSILITKGIAAEIDPTLEMYLYFPTCTYNRENITITDVTLATFTLNFRTIDYSSGSPKSNRRKYEGEIQLTDDQWTVTFDDGIVTTL